MPQPLTPAERNRRQELSNRGVSLFEPLARRPPARRSPARDRPRPTATDGGTDQEQPEQSPGVGVGAGAVTTLAGGHVVVKSPDDGPTRIELSDSAAVVGATAAVLVGIALGAWSS